MKKNVGVPWYRQVLAETSPLVERPPIFRLHLYSLSQWVQTHGLEIGQMLGPDGNDSKKLKYRDGTWCPALTNQTSKGRILIFDSLTFRPGVFNEQQKTVTKKKTKTLLMFTITVHNEIIIDVNLHPPKKHRCNLHKKKTIKCSQGDTLIMDNFHKPLCPNENISKNFESLSNKIVKFIW